MEGGGPMKGFINGVFSYSSSNYLSHRENASKRLAKTPINLDGCFFNKFYNLDREIT